VLLKEANNTAWLVTRKKKRESEIRKGDRKRYIFQVKVVCYISKKSVTRCAVFDFVVVDRDLSLRASPSRGAREQEGRAKAKKRF